MMKKQVFTIVLLSVLFSGLRGHAAEKLTLMLDWFPNVDHVPVYAAMQKGFFREKGLSIEILSPSDSADPLKLAAAGHVDLALSYQPQAIIAASAGIELRAVGRLVGTPLTTMLFLKGSGISAPADLTGKIIGYTVPGMMDRLADAFAFINGIGDYRLVNVGFTILQALVSGEVDAVMGPFKNYEPAAMEMEGYQAGFFEIEHYGIPPYDELVFITGARGLEKRRAEIGRFLEALEEGIVFTLEHPEEALEIYFRAVPEAPREMERKAFMATYPLFGPDTKLDVNRWKAFADFALKYGLIEREVNVDELLVRP